MFIVLATRAVGANVAGDSASLVVAATLIIVKPQLLANGETAWGDFYHVTLLLKVRPLGTVIIY